MLQVTSVEEKLIFLAYGALLRRAPTIQQIASYLADLRSGLAAADLLRKIAEKRDAETSWEDWINNQLSPSVADRLPVLAEVTLPPPQVAALFRATYEAFLGRSPADNEVAHYVGIHNGGTPLVNLIAAIAESEEAFEHWERSRAVTKSTSVNGVDALRFQRANGSSISFEELSTIFDRAEKKTGCALPKDVGLALAVVLAALGIDGRQATVANQSGPVVSPGIEAREDFEKVIKILYRRLLKREAAPSEIQPWYNHYVHNYLLSSIIFAIDGSEEAQGIRAGLPKEIWPGTSVQIAYEIILGRGASAQEVDAFRVRLERTGLTMDELVLSFFKDAANRRLSGIGTGPTSEHDPDVAYLFGSHGLIKSSHWKLKPRVRQAPQSNYALAPDSLFAKRPVKPGRVGIITSIFKGGQYIGPFLENITSQTIFIERCELIFIDAASTENEYETIKKYMDLFPNIIYYRTDTTVGIYEAWNIGIKLSGAEYFTNANLDDCRRSDSLELQAAVLDTLKFVDVAYQDVSYYFEKNATFGSIIDENLITNLPIISKYNIAEFNSPHNGPMWRKRLHQEIGYFNEHYKSASDYEFWVRCLIAGKCFYKINDPHVGYYVNPQGLSTRADSLGAAESWAISKQFFRQLVSPLLTMPDENFATKVGFETDSKKLMAGRYRLVQDALIGLGCAYRRLGLGA